MRRIFPAVIALASVTVAHADELFTTKIEPLLKQRCFECHSHEKKMRGGLTLDSRSGWEKGGDLGPAVVPGKPEESLLIRMVRWSDDEHQMPPKEKLPPAEIALLEEELLPAMAVFLARVEAIDRAIEADQELEVEANQAR